MKFKRTYDIRKVVTPKVFELMKLRKPFLYLVDEDFLFYIESDIDRWVNSHGLLCDIKRVIGHGMRDRNDVPGYLIHCSADIHSIMIPMEKFEDFPIYEDFMKQLENEIELNTKE